MGDKKQGSNVILFKNILLYLFLSIISGFSIGCVGDQEDDDIPMAKNRSKRSVEIYELKREIEELRKELRRNRGQRIQSIKIFNEGQINAIKDWEKDTSRYLSTQKIDRYISHFDESYFYARRKKKRKILSKEITISLPDSMTMNSDTIASISIANNLVGDSISLPGSSRYKHELLDFSDKISVTLESPVNGKFDINSLNTEEQVIRGSNKTTWTWNIKAISYGDAQLSIKYKSKWNDRDDYQDMLNLHPVYVSSTFKQRAIFQFSKNQPLIVSISTLLPLTIILGFWKRFRRLFAKKPLDYWTSTRSY